MVSKQRMFFNWWTRKRRNEWISESGSEWVMSSKWASGSEWIPGRRLFEAFFFIFHLPTHVVSIPLHEPVAIHVLSEDPWRMNPGSQLKCTLLGKVVELPYEEPFKGEDKAPQSTAENEEICNIHIEADKATLRLCMFRNWWSVMKDSVRKKTYITKATSKENKRQNWTG